jgi:hypothetical protein
MRGKVERFVTGSAKVRDLDVAIGGNERPREESVLIARVADEVGIGNLWVTEGTGRDAFSLLTEIALATERIGLGTGIVNVFSRTPTALVQATATVMEVMQHRRFNLGVGASGKALMQQYHGVPFDRPITRLWGKRSASSTRPSRTVSSHTEVTFSTWAASPWACPCLGNVSASTWQACPPKRSN